jgi:drug/metabolite transporter (DMT)-like permease
LSGITAKPLLVVNLPWIQYDAATGGAGDLMSLELVGKLMALLCAFLWAFAVIFFKRSGESLRPIALNLYKSVISIVLFLILMIFRGEPLFPQDATLLEYGMLIGSGILGIAISDTFFFKSLNILGAGFSAIIDCMYSPSLIVLSCLLLSEHIGVKQLIGALLVVSAVLVASF